MLFCVCVVLCLSLCCIVFVLRCVVLCFCCVVFVLCCVCVVLCGVCVVFVLCCVCVVFVFVLCLCCVMFVFVLCSQANCSYSSVLSVSFCARQSADICFLVPWVQSCCRHASSIICGWPYAELPSEVSERGKSANRNWCTGSVLFLSPSVLLLIFYLYEVPNSQWILRRSCPVINSISAYGRTWIGFPIAVQSAVSKIVFDLTDSTVSIELNNTVINLLGNEN